MRTYSELIEQTYEFPTEEFEVVDGELYFHGMRLMDFIESYEAPLKLNYLPKIAENINRAQRWFQDAFEQLHYQGNYQYAFCTKASHFKFILEKTLMSRRSSITSLLCCAGSCIKGIKDEEPSTTI